jgi:AbrB family looped-hinge helix DNA binding protein
MPVSTITSKGQTTVPKEVRDALHLEPGDKLTWEINGGRVAITTDRPGLWRWKGLSSMARTIR